MKFLITGGSGQLGYDLIRELKEQAYNDVYAPSSKECDITNKEQVNKIVSEYKPDYIYHCAAYTNVDMAEDEMEKCYQINYIGTKNIAEAAYKINAKVIYISTDYVFDGDKVGYYYTDDERRPVNYYGYTKKLGEDIIEQVLDDYLIVRISWVFGINGKNFIKTMLKLSETKSEINVVADQYGSPTYTRDAVKALINMRQDWGVVHLTNDGYCSWYDLVKYLFANKGIKTRVNPITTDMYPTKAKRPINSKLSKIELDYYMPSWQDAVDRFCEELRREKE